MHNENAVVSAFLLAIFFVGACFGWFVGFGDGKTDGRKETMQEAFDYGKAVQCIGREGYYWDCAARDTVKGE